MVKTAFCCAMFTERTQSWTLPQRDHKNKIQIKKDKMISGNKERIRPFGFFFVRQHFQYISGYITVFNIFHDRGKDLIFCFFCLLCSLLHLCKMQLH